MSTSNATRAERARDALESYIEAKGEIFEACTDEITDLIADLLHLAALYADEDGGNVEAYVEKSIRVGRLHFDAEHGNPEEEAV